MSNDYYNAPSEIAKQSRARSTEVNARFSAVAAGFEKLPGRDELWQGKVAYATAGGTADVLTLTLTDGSFAYSTGQVIRVLIGSTNTGAATIDVNSAGVRAIQRVDGTALSAGDLTAGDIVDLIYNGTAFLLGQGNRVSAANETAAAASAAAAAASVTDIEAKYIGSYANDAAADAAHPSAADGVIYFNTTDGGLKVRISSAWNNAVFDGDGYAPLAGATFTGDVTFEAIIETEQTDAANSLTLDPANGTRVTMTLTATGTISDSLADGEHMSVRVLNGDTYTLNHPAGTLFVNGSAPTLTGDDRLTYEKWGTDLICYAGTGIA